MMLPDPSINPAMSLGDHASFGPPLDFRRRSLPPGIGRAALSAQLDGDAVSWRVAWQPFSLELERGR